MTKAGNSQIMRTITLLITIFSLSLPAYAKYSGGTGEPNDPYQIATAEDLIKLGETPEDYDKHFILTADIDLDPNLPGRKVFDKAVIPPHLNSEYSLPFAGTPFIGVFDGDSYKISHLTILGTHNLLGLFGQLGSRAQVKSLGVVDVNIVGSGEYVGGVVGSNWGTVIQCYSSGTVTGDRWVGGLVGENYGFIIASYSSGTVTGDIATSYSKGMVTGDDSVGGLVGVNLGNGNIATSYSSSTITGDGWVGGLAGVNDNTITNCYATGSILVSGTKLSPGVGGGLVGENLSVGKISNCYATGSVLVSGTELSPGVGGGLVGENGGEVMNSLWDTQASGQAKSDGGTGKTTSEMQMESTFTDAGWDFLDESENGTEGTWNICEGINYPRLTWQFIVGDFNGDNYVDFADFCIFAAHWLGTDSSFFCKDGGTDLTSDGKIDINDMRVFAKYWLKPQPPEPPQLQEPSPPPPKGRTCFLPDTPVWVNGGLVQISNVLIGQMVGLSDNIAPANVCSGSIEEIEEHEGLFEYRDIVLESGDCINVVDAHCFMLDSGQWIAAQDLKSGLRLKTQHSTVSIKHIEVRVVPFVGKVYNLKVKGVNQYFVGRDRVIVRDY